MNVIAKTPSIFIEKQFPSIYREEASELITLVEAYYEFLETQTNQSIYNVRRMFEYRDIDSTLVNMLIFYRNKFLKGLPFDQDNIRFIVKNVMELYRRKGSKEGIELFFKMFFDEEIELFYPSYSMLKPSSSSWKVGRYLQLNPVEDVTVFSDIVNKKIYGSVSTAEAFVDRIYFIKANQSLLPVIFISSIKGQFIGSDVIFTTSPIRKEYGRVYGSLETLNSIETFDGTKDNKVGDILNVSGDGAKGGIARVTDVAEELSGEILFEVVNGEYGYTQEGTSIIISNQSIFIDNEELEFFPYERISQLNMAETYYATIIGQDKQSIGILLDDETKPFSLGNFNTIDRENNITKESLFVLETNSSAFASVGDVVETEEINIIVDLISDFLDVPLNSSNFSTIPPALAAMSGGVANLTTPLNVAFVPQTFNAGKISTLSNVSPGLDYTNNVFILARENILSKFDLKNQVIVYNTTNTNVNLLVGDIVLQDKTIVDFFGESVSVQAKGKIVERQGNVIYIKPLSFQSFIKNNSFYKQDTTIDIEIIALSRDDNSLPYGFNAEITGKSVFLPGKILSADVIDSGIGYIHNATASMNNVTKTERYKKLLDDAISSNENQTIIDQYQVQYDNSLTENSAQGIIQSRGQGKTDGKWETFTSHLNSEYGKVLQDSLYYQDFSYEVSSSLSPDLYLQSLLDVAHPVGMSLFSAFAKLDSINNVIDIYTTIENYTITESVLVSENDQNIIVADDGSQYLVSTII